MPVMDGEEATQLIRDFEQRRYPGLRTPIIATTAHAYKEDLERWSKMGMDGFLLKPISCFAESPEKADSGQTW